MFPNEKIIFRSKSLTFFEIVVDSKEIKKFLSNKDKMIYYTMIDVTNMRDRLRFLPTVRELGGQRTFAFVFQGAESHDFQLGASPKSSAKT